MHSVIDAVHVTQVAEFIIKNAGEYQGSLSSTAVDPFTGKSSSFADCHSARNLHWRWQDGHLSSSMAAYRWSCIPTGMSAWALARIHTKLSHVSAVQYGS